MSLLAVDSYKNSITSRVTKQRGSVGARKIEEKLSRLSLVTGLRGSDTFVGRSEVFHFTRRLTISKQRVNYEPQQSPARRRRRATFRGRASATCSLQSRGNVASWKRKDTDTKGKVSGSGRNWTLKRAGKGKRELKGRADTLVEFQRK